MHTATPTMAPLDLKTASDAELALVHDFFSKMRAERHPHDPPVTPAENLARWRSLPPFVHLTGFGVWNPDPQITSRRLRTFGGCAVRPWQRRCLLAPIVIQLLGTLV